MIFRSISLYVKYYDRILGGGKFQSATQIQLVCSQESD